MNNKSTIEEKKITIGQLLSQSRKTLGFSQEKVAKKLCLKLCIIRNIDEDIQMYNINYIFLRGYICSYAKLVKIPEKEIITLLNKYVLKKTFKVSSIKSYSSKKIDKKEKYWLIIFIILIIFISIVMIIIWWQRL